MESELTEHLGAEPHERTEERTGQRNGHYERRLTTRVGSIELWVPRARNGTFSTALFDRYQRSEKALVLAIMEMVSGGVSTRKVKKITEKLCGREFAKSTVSDLAKDLNEQVEAWNERPLDDLEYPFVLGRCDAAQSPSAGRCAVEERPGPRRCERDGLPGDSRCPDCKLGVEAKLDGEVPMAEGARSERRRAGGLGRPGGLGRGAAAVLPGSDLAAVPDPLPTEHHRQDSLELRGRHARGSRRDLRGDDPDEARSAFNELAADLEGKADRALETLELGLEDATAVLRLPKKYRRRLRTTNALERLIQEVRRREKVIRIFPNEESAWRLIGAYLAERHEEWATGRRYFTMDEYDSWKRSIDEDEGLQPVAAE